MLLVHYSQAHRFKPCTCFMYGRNQSAYFCIAYVLGSGSDCNRLLQIAFDESVRWNAHTWAARNKPTTMCLCFCCAVRRTELESVYVVKHFVRHSIRIPEICKRAYGTYVDSAHLEYKASDGAREMQRYPHSGNSSSNSVYKTSSFFATTSAYPVCLSRSLGVGIIMFS